MDSAIRGLNELRLGSAVRNLGSAAGTSDVAPEVNVQLQSQGKFVAKLLGMVIWVFLSGLKCLIIFITIFILTILKI